MTLQSGKEAMQDFEQLGAFYLGREFNQETGNTTDNLLLYDARVSTTHGVIVGMTGSGKTGLAHGAIAATVPASAGGACR